MDRATQLALSRINHRFYAAVAPDWQDKRKHPWPGFERVWRGAPAADSGGTSVLDVGCGDGRFAQFLAGKDPHALSYLGLDSSAALLAFAKQRALGPAFRFEQADVTTDLRSQLHHEAYDLIALLGVLHHIPGFDQRAALLQTLAAALSPHGQLVLTVWRLDEDPRFASRIVDVAAYNELSDEPLDHTQLEPGDHLLCWDGNGNALPRYCHFPDEAELSRLIASGGLHARERFRADGHQNRMNEYVVLTRSSP